MKPYYERDGVRLFLGDCTEFTPEKEWVCMTDPPYKVGSFQQIGSFVDSNGKGKGKNGSRSIGRDFHEDYDQKAIEPSTWMAKMPDVVVSFFGAKSMEKLLRAFRKNGYSIVQDFHYCKPAPPAMRGVGFSWAVESGYVAKRKGTKSTANKEAGHSPNYLISSNRNSIRSSDRDTDHTSAKPVQVMRWLVRWLSRPDLTIYDPFCGSGTTGIACIELGRSFVGVEIEEKYCEESAKFFDRAFDRRRMSFHVLD